MKKSEANPNCLGSGVQMIGEVAPTRRCPVCGKIVALTSTSRLRAHKPKAKK